MPKTLAELRNSRAVALPERSYPLCLSQKLVAEVQALGQEKYDIGVADLTPDGEKKPRRLGQEPDPRLGEIDERLEELYEEMRDHTGDLVIRAQQSGWWTTWRDEHPARISERDNDGRPIVNAIDQVVTQGWCDASALLADLGRYVVSYNGEPVDAEAWEFISASAAPGDLKEICSLVVTMQEGTGAKPPKASSRPSSTSQTSAPDLPSPAPSESPNDAS